MQNKNWRKGVAAAAAGLIAFASTLVAAPAASAVDYEVIPGESVASVFNSETTLSAPGKVSVWDSYNGNKRIKFYDTSGKEIGKFGFVGVIVDGTTGLGVCVQPTVIAGGGNNPMNPAEGAALAGQDPAAVQKITRLMDYITDASSPSQVDRQRLYSKLAIPSTVEPDFVYGAIGLAVWHMVNANVSVVNEGGQLTINAYHPNENNLSVFASQILDLSRSEINTASSVNFTAKPSSIPSNDEFFAIYQGILNLDLSGSEFEGSLDIDIDAAASTATDAGNNVDVNLVFPTPKAYKLDKAASTQDNGKYVPAEVTYEVYNKATNTPVEATASESGANTSLEFTIPSADAASDYVVKAKAEGVSGAYWYSDNQQDVVSNPIVNSQMVASQPFRLQFDVPTPEMGTSIKAEDNGVIPADAGSIDVADTINVTNFAAGRYLFKGTIYPVADGVLAGEAVGNGSAIFTYADGKWTDESGAEVANPVVNFTGVNVEAGKSYVAFEEAYKLQDGESTASGDAYATHVDPEDASQTFTVTKKEVEQSFKTVVSSGDNSATDTLALSVVAPSEGNISLVDTIKPEGDFVAGDYEFTATVVDAATTQPIAGVDPVTASFKFADGTWTASDANGEIKDGLPGVKLSVPVSAVAAGKSYVIFESGKLVDGSWTGKHEDVSDQSQTFTVTENKVAYKGEIGTTVKAGEAGANKAAGITLPVSEVLKDGVAQAVTVVDTVKYSGFQPSAEYTFVGTLMDVTGGKEPVAIADPVKKTIKTTNTGAGTVEITFAGVTGLVPGGTYVVFENAFTGTNTSVKPFASHEEADDASQTFVVEKEETGTPPSSEENTLPKTPDEGSETSVTPLDPKMKTTVEANGVASSSDEAVNVTAADAASAQGVEVVDTIEYSGFEAGKTYTFMGSLVDVTDGNKVVAVAATTVVNLAAADGSVKVDFGKITTLQAGHKYVVFERAYKGTVGVPSVVPSVDNGSKNEAGFPENPVVTHADKNDKAQTIVVGPGREGSSISPWWLLVPVVPAVIGGLVYAAGSSQTPVETPVAPTSPAPAPEVKVPSKGIEKRPMLAQTGANVLWVVLAGLIAAIAGGLLVSRRKNA